MQGWEFALWFFERIARFLKAKVRKSNLFLKKNESLMVALL